MAQKVLRERGFLGPRKTKVVCTISHTFCSGKAGIARDECDNREWHKEVI